MFRPLILVPLLALFTFVVAPPARAENMAYQFVCTSGSAERRTPWIDERVSRVTFFDRARSGASYYYCVADCGEYGPGGCGFTPVGELGHYDPWTERLSALDCDKVCLHLRAVDGQMNAVVSNTDITRYATTYSGFSTLSWWVQSHDGSNPYDVFFQHHDASGVRDGYILCWDGSWNDNYWIAQYGDPGTSGRKTVVTLDDSHGVAHTFTVGGFYNHNNHTADEW